MARLPPCSPGILVAPQYFAKTIELGGVVQVIQAFGNVQDSLSWFVSAYSTLADYKATVDRLTGFRRSLRRQGRGPFDRDQSRGRPRADLAVDGPALALPDGQA